MFNLIVLFFSLFPAETNLHVPVIDEFFIAFLRPCKYYPKSAFERVRVKKRNPGDTLYKKNFFLSFQMKKYYKLKQKHPRLFEDLYPMSVRHVYEQDILTLLPLRDKKGSRMLLMEVGSKKLVHSFRYGLVFFCDL